MNPDISSKASRKLGQRPTTIYQRIAVHGFGVVTLFAVLDFISLTSTVSASEGVMFIVGLFVVFHVLYRFKDQRKAQVTLRKPTILAVGFLGLFGIYALFRTDPLFNRYGFPIAAGYLKNLAMALLLVVCIKSGRDLNTIAIYGVAGATAGSLVSLTVSQTRATVAGINPVLMGYIFVLGIVLCVFVYAQSKTIISRWLLKVFGAMMGIGVLISGSRGAYLTLFTFVFVSLIFFRSRIKSIAAANIHNTIFLTSLGIGLVATVTYAMTEKIMIYLTRTRRLLYILKGPDALQELDTASLLTRYQIHQIGLEMFLHRPLFGYGFGTFQTYAESHELLLSPIGPHSFYVSTISQLGLVGTALFAVPVLLIFKLAFTQWHYDSVPKGEINRLLILLAGFVAVLVQALSVEVVRLKQSWILIALLFAQYEVTAAKADSQSDGYPVAE